MNDWYLEFWKKNKKLILTHLAITILILPLEILILTVYTKKLFTSLQSNNFELFIQLFIGFIIFLSLLQLLYVWREYLDSLITPRVQSFIRNKCLKKYVSQPRDSFQAGTVMGSISSLPRYFYQNYQSLFKFWIPFYTVFLFYVIYLFWIDIKVGIYSVIMFSVLLLTFTLVFRKLSSFDYRETEHQNKLLFYYENVLVNSETIQAYNRHAEEIESLENLERKFEIGRFRLIFCIDAAKLCFIIIVFIYLLSVFYYLYKKLMSKEDSFPQWKFISFITILFFVVRTIISLTNQFRHIVSLSGNLYNTSSLGTCNNKTIKMQEYLKNYNIKIDNVSFAYPSNPNLFIFENFNLYIKENSNLLIKGQIGSGKSTIAKLLSKVYIPNDGEITIGGVNIHMIPMQQYKNIVFMMSQNTTLFSGKTVLENISYGYKKQLKREDMNDFNLPSTFESILDKKIIEHGINISGGQKRMVYILRSLLHPARIVILDEPTDSLDQDSSNYIYKAIQKLQKTKTVICISHDPKLENIFSNILDLKE